MAAQAEGVAGVALGLEELKPRDPDMSAAEAAVEEEEWGVGGGWVGFCGGGIGGASGGRGRWESGEKFESAVRALDVGACYRRWQRVRGIWLRWKSPIETEERGHCRF